MTAASRLLIIDDDIRLASLLQEYLEPYGFAVDLAHTGPEGLAQATRADYAVIILDVMLPGMNGHEVLRELRKQSLSPVLMFTALGSEEERIEGLDGGADDYLPKTSSTTELLARVRALVRRSTLTAHQRRELKEDRRDLDQALQIQLALLPRTIPKTEGFDISGIWLPARTVSGDYYDVIPMGKDRIGLCIGDVSGKGMAAALLMASVQATVKAFASQSSSPAELCDRVNAVLCGNTTDEKFMSFFYGVIERSSGQFVYTCAGHNPPLLVRKDGSEIRLSTGGTLLGLFADAKYENATVLLSPGDRMLLYTDGVTEVKNASEEEFGEQRLLEIMRSSSEWSAATLTQAILDAVSGFGGGSPFQDDVTCVALRVQAGPKP